MVKTSSVLLVGVCGLALFGCASMNKAECLVSDWQMIGYEDGARGYGSQHLARHRKACAKHGVAPDLAAYQQGRSEGLCRSIGVNRPRALHSESNGAAYAGVAGAPLTWKRTSWLMPTTRATIFGSSERASPAPGKRADQLQEESAGDQGQAGHGGQRSRASVASSVMKPRARSQRNVSSCWGRSKSCPRRVDNSRQRSKI